MTTAEWNVIRETLEEALISTAKQLIEHTGAASFVFPATDGNPEIKVSQGT